MPAPDGEAPADLILRCAGGPGNVTRLTHCFVRLRFRLRDPAAADLDTLRAHPLVALAVWQADELHIAPRRDLFRLFADLRAVLGDTAVS
ncbi:PTS transporter subunit EIIB [Streptomyces sp. NPDC047000]|uniref:PTS transporter subunit EIIB n=1 Tax=Streptomyces sp. NPDC047000 TaxID=3155474 RepID=UPI0033C4815B